MTKQRKAIFSCLCIGLIALAFGVGMLSAKAVEETDTPTFTMERGAAVRVPDTINDKTGIRWTASFNEAYWNTLATDGKTVEFGAVVAPAENVNGELTVATSKAKCVPCPATTPTFDNGTFTYYASIVYDAGDLTEDERKQASAVELTARAYIKIGDEYTYVDEYDNSTRCMRAIALAAVQDGTVDASKVNAYYGTETSAASDNTGYYSDVDKEGALTNPNNLSGTYQAYIGANPVTMEITADGLKVSGASGLEAQKEYHLNAFVNDDNNSNNVYSQPLIAATKVIDEATDLSYFTMKNIVLGTNDNNLPYATEGTTEFDGYYVLTENIDATGYTHEVTDRANSDNLYTGQNSNNSQRSKLDRISTTSLKEWMVKNYVPSVSGGLTGTFDGNGYTISNLTVAHHGLFGLIIGGTVKDLGLVNAQLGPEGSTYEHRVIFAEQMVDATIQNVYLQMADDTIRGSKAALSMTTAGNLTMKNCVFDFDIYASGGAVPHTTTNPWAYGLFGSTTSYITSYADTTFDCSDVYVRSNVAISVTLAGGSYTYNTSVAIAENDAENDDRAIEKAAFELIGGTVKEDGTFERNGKTWTPVTGKYIFNKTSSGSHIRRIEGMYRYDTATEMESANNAYSSFDNELWAYGDGMIAFKSTVKTLAHAVEGTYYMDASTGTFTSEDMTKMFGSEDAKIVSAELNGTALTVEDGAITSGFEDISTHGTKVELTIKIEGKELPYNVSVIPATKLIQTTDDLANVFKMTNIVVTKNASVEGTTEFAGYYVLADDIDASGYTHEITDRTQGENTTITRGTAVYSKLLATITKDYNGTLSYSGVVSNATQTGVGGLTGTFDGNGHTIKNLTVKEYGLFGLVTNGTIKNVGFTNVAWADSTNMYEPKALFAAKMLSPTLENVYVEAQPIYNGTTEKRVGHRALLSIVALGTITMKDCLFKFNIPDVLGNTNAVYSYGLFAATTTVEGSHKATFNCTNAYAITDTALVCTINTGHVYVNDHNLRVVFAANETMSQEALFTLIGGVITETEEGKTYTLGETSWTNLNLGNWWCQTKASGIDRYNTVEDMMADTANDYTAFNAAYWTVTDESVSWNVD